LDERELLRLATQGDVRAFEALIEPRLASIRRFARAFCRNPADADDLAQEALLRAFRALPKYRGDAALSTWLYTVARSTFLDWRRSKATRMGTLEEPLAEDHSNDDPRQDDLLNTRLEVERLWAAIGQLDPRFRTVIVLFDIEGLSYEEIASVEALPVGTVRSRLSRARKHLLELLGASGGQEVAAPPGTAVDPTPSNQAAGSSS
jgi:RNA polymerase sigma-70 factor (ECF subfamily)